MAPSAISNRRAARMALEVMRKRRPLHHLSTTARKMFRTLSFIETTAIANGRMQYTEGMQSRTGLMKKGTPTPTPPPSLSKRLDKLRETK